MKKSNDLLEAPADYIRKDTAIQIRPNTPDSCPLLWEKADEGRQPDLRIMHGFTPKWFCMNMELDYGERWHEDVDYRRNTLIEMKQTLNRHFPSLRLGGNDEEIYSMGGTLSVLKGTTTIAAIFGVDVLYESDNWPANPPGSLSLEDAYNLTVPDLDSNPVFIDIVRQMGEIEEKYGKIEGLLNIQGVLNNAFRVRGQEIFIDIMENPDLAHHLFSVISETMIKVVKAVYERQNKSGVERDYFVTSNCVVNMLSSAHYEEFILPYDKKLSESFTYFGIHNCAWNVDPYIDSYKKIDKLGYLDFGLDSDLERLAETFPKARLCLMYSPVELERKSLDDIAKDLQYVHDMLTPCEIILTDIEDTCPDQRVVDFFSLAGNIWDMEPHELVPAAISR